MKVLLLQIKRIGDLILTVPAIAAVRKHFPQAQLTLVAAHGSRELLPAIPGLNRTLTVRGGARDLLVWASIGRGGFDYCLDFSRTDRSAFLTFLSRGRERITYDSIRREPVRQLCYNQFIPSRVRDVHTVDHHLALLAPLGVHDASPEIRLQLPENARAGAAAIVAEHGLGDGFVIFHPGSARAEKYWLAERWAEVANALRGRWPVVLSGGNLLMEQMHIREIKSRLQQPIIDLAGKVDLLTLAALLERARLLVTIDSAPMHLAGALGTPQVALFGPTNPFHWRPRSAPAVILQGKAPAQENFLPRQQPVRMNEISTEQVIDAMQSLLSRPAAQKT